VANNKYINSKSNDDKDTKNNKKKSKKEFKTKHINKHISNIKLNNEPETNLKKKMSKINNRIQINNSEEKLKKNRKEISPFQNKILKKEKPTEKNLVKNKKKLSKKLFSPINKVAKHSNNLDRKEHHNFNTLESNDKLTAKKNRNKFEMNEKRIKVKKNLNLNYDVNPVNKLYKTEFSFRTPTQSLLSRENNKIENKNLNKKGKIISIDKIKNSNKIINRKKKIDNILNHSNKNLKINENIKRSKNIGLNINLKRIKETKEGKTKKNELRNLFLESKDNNNIRKEKNKNNDSISSWESDLGDVGEIIEDDGESEFGTELNELNENNFINNPKSINTYSSIIFMSNNEKKRFSLSVNKTDISSNFHTSFSSNYKTNITQIKIEKNNYKFKDSQEIHDKIRKKENDIEKVKKLIEIVKRNIKYYDKEIIELEKSIQNEEQVRDEYQMLINYLNLK